MENPDTLYIILKNFELKETLLMKTDVSKNFVNCVKNVINDKLKLWKSFITIKNKTIFKKDFKRKLCYYTFKNRYINKEATPLLLF